MEQQAEKTPPQPTSAHQRAERAPKPVTVESLKQELDHKAKEADDYLNHLKRLQADFENFIKRTEKERKTVLEYAAENLITKMLVVLDELERSLDVLTKQGVSGEQLRGLQLVYRNFHKILQDEGVQAIESTGKADPYLHEVMLTEPRDGVEDGTILQELQKGYRLKGKVIRYAKVKVAKTPGGH